MSAKTIECPRCHAPKGKECKGGGMCIERFDAYNDGQDPALGKRAPKNLEGPGAGNP